ncbi:hypothetical protein [Pedobacter sp. L105]|uniref:hypothetical protein n=1 Tax=Pedobacter sp. L105 TaxID=1641871 RepID=UPI00131C4698|nr:hypothetical protein [Pedobacter sp. L105]
MERKIKPKRNKIWIWLPGILVFLCAIAVAGWYFLKKDLENPNSKIVKPLLIKELKKLITRESNGLYSISYSRFELDVKSGSGLITGLKLIPDSLVFKQLEDGHKAPNNEFKMGVDSLILKKFRFVKTKNGRKFTIGFIGIVHPVVKIINKRRLYNDTVSNSSPSLLKKMAKNLLKGINVSHMVMKNITLTYLNENEQVVKRTALKNLTFSLSGITVDSLANIGRCRIKTPDSLYDINLNGIQLSLKTHQLLVKLTSIIPRLSTNAFYKTVNYDKDRIHMVFNDMKMSGINIDRFLKKQELHIGQISIANSTGEVFNNYFKPRKIPPVREHKYPHERLQGLALDLTIDTLTMHKSSLSYQMAAKKSGEVANFFMTHAENRVYHITNNTAEKKRNHYATAVIHSRVMDAANLSVFFKFNLTAKNGAFTYTICVGKMDGRALNSLSVPLAMTSIESANVEKMLLKVKANDRSAKGNIDLYYTHMKISLLKPDQKADTLKKKKILSFVANALLPNDNPGKNGKLRKGPINVTRDPRMSFLGFMYKGMLDGMTSLISGTNQHKSKPDKNILINIGRKIVKPLKTIRTSP